MYIASPNIVAPKLSRNVRIENNSFSVILFILSPLSVLQKEEKETCPLSLVLKGNNRYRFDDSTLSVFYHTLLGLAINDP